MIDFENPFAFFFLLLIPALYFLRKIKIFSRITFPLTLSNWNGENFTWKKTFRNFISTVVKIFTICGFIFTVIAFADPVVHHQEKVYVSRGSDILFVIDISPSMAAKDISNSTRLEAAKQAIKTLVSNNGGESFGLVEMAKEAAVIVPITTDSNVLLKKLDNLNVGEMGDGTAIGNGLSCAVYHLQNSKAPKKSIVLITDGENNAGSIHPHTAAKLAKEENISLYILGIGTKGTVALEYVDPKTNKLYSGYLDSNYNSNVLSELALEADGKFFNVENMNALSQALGTIDKQESVMQSYHIRNHDDEYYSYALFFAAIFFIIAWLLRRVYLQEMF